MLAFTVSPLNAPTQSDSLTKMPQAQLRGTNAAGRETLGGVILGDRLFVVAAWPSFGDKGSWVSGRAYGCCLLACSCNF